MIPAGIPSATVAWQSEARRLRAEAPPRSRAQREMIRRGSRARYRKSVRALTLNRRHIGCYGMSATVLQSITETAPHPPEAIPPELSRHSQSVPGVPTESLPSFLRKTT